MVEDDNITYEDDFDKEEELKESSTLREQVKNNQNRSQHFNQSVNQVVKGSVMMFAT